MSYWDTAVERASRQFSAAQFEAAAYRLLTEQVLYASDQRSRVSYRLVEQFEREYKAALAPFGIRLSVNRAQFYACAIPTHEKVFATTTEQTLLALVLRKLHDESARLGQFSDHGEVACDLIELTQRYQQLTQRELPSGGKLESLLQTMQRWGIARTVEQAQTAPSSGVEQPYEVMIRPAIVEILGEAALEQLALHRKHPTPQEEQPLAHDVERVGDDSETPEIAP